MRKNIDLSDEAVKALSIQAIEYGMEIDAISVSANEH